MVVAAMAMMMLLNLLLLCLLSLLAALIDDFDVVVQNRGDDGNHIGFDYTGPYVLGASHTNIDNTLESEIPLPHAHHILAAALLKNADQTLDAAIDCEDVADTSRGCGQVSEMIERVDERQSRGAVKSPTVVKGCCDAHRRLVDVGDTEVDFPHLVFMCWSPDEGGYPMQGDNGRTQARLDAKTLQYLGKNP